MTIFKSICAIVAGFVTVVLLSVGTDWLLEASGVFSSQTNPGAYTALMLAFALFYRTLYTIAGGYVAAKLAPSRPMRHAVILGLLGTAAGTLGAIASWNLTPEHWYPVALAVLALPSTWLGGKLFRVTQKQEVSL